MSERYSLREAHEIAERIHAHYHDCLQAAASAYDVPAHWLAGLTGMENPHCKEWPNPGATRFEPGVFEHLVALVEGREHSYNGVEVGHLKGLDSQGLRSLALSYGQTQIMGYYIFILFNRPLSEITKSGSSVGPHASLVQLRDPQLHYYFTAFFWTHDTRMTAYVARTRQLQLGSVGDRAAFYHLAHLWNSGREWDGSGTLELPEHTHTYSPDYMFNCWLVGQSYLGILQTDAEESGSTMAQAAQVPPTPEPGETSDSPVPVPVPAAIPISVTPPPPPERPSPSIDPGAQASSVQEQPDPVRLHEWLGKPFDSPEEKARQISPAPPVPIASVPISPGWHTSEAHLTAAFTLVAALLSLAGFHYTPERVASVYDAVTHIIETVGPLVAAIPVLWNYITSRGKLKSNAVNAASRSDS